MSSNDKRRELREAGAQDSASTKFEIQRELERIKSQDNAIIEGNILDKNIQEKMLSEGNDDEVDPTIKEKFEQILKTKELSGESQNLDD